MNYKTIDLCAGIGGIRRGFELTKKFENVCSAETDDLACKTYELLFHENPKNDLTSEEFKNKVKCLRYDVLLAGFPCQAFSSVGLKKGFEDKTKGTIFFEIAKIIEQTKPMAVFLENVENLVIHDKGRTFKTIIEVLENELDYHVIGVSHDKDGVLTYEPRKFIRNSKNFGIPQNRPRVYIVAFSRSRFGNHLSILPDHMPESSGKTIYDSVLDLLEEDVGERYFLSSGYLKTLEDHRERQKKRGYGFGYRIINGPGIEKPIASTLLATGGSGRERNLIIDKKNGNKYANKTVKGKFSPVNTKFIRTMTPTEWGRLQGFINYGFVENGQDRFAFPEDVPNVHRYKQMGNSVTIPVIETMAEFIATCLDDMTGQMDETELRVQTMYGRAYTLCSRFYSIYKGRMRNDTLNRLIDMIIYFSDSDELHSNEIARFLGVTPSRGSQILSMLCESGFVIRTDWRSCSFRE